VRTAAFALLAGVLAGCGAAAAPNGVTGVMPASRESSGNIYWNKRDVRLTYPSSSHGRAVLTYWAPNGYYTDGPTCKHGGLVKATAHRSWGNPSGYMHVVYWFEARTRGPDRCGFSAILLGTGSPPIAPIALRVVR